MMNKYLAFAICMLAVVGPLAAIGYTSAYVQSEADYAQYLEELEVEEEDDFQYKSEGYGSGAFPSVARSSTTYSLYDQAKQLQLAIPSFDPISDTTTKLVYGLMDVILSRFKQQLFISSITQWRDELLRSDFKALFPNLSKLLTSIDSGSFMSSYDLWKSAIDKDLQEAPVGVLSFSLAVREKDPRFSDVERAQLTEMKNLVGDVYKYRAVKNLDEYIMVSTSSQTQSSDFFRLIGTVAKNMLDSEGTIVLDELKSCLETDAWKDIYLDYINDDMASIEINGDCFEVNDDNLKYYLDSCETVEQFFRKLDPVLNADKELDTEAYLSLYLDTCDKLLIQWSNLAVGIPNDWDEYYRLFTSHRFEVEAMARLIDDRQYKSLLNAVITTSVTLAQDQNVVPVSYSRFMNLISTLALTGEEDEVSYGALINSVLEPVGSYSYKREANLTVALNAYPGLGGGAETLDSNLKNAKGVAGLACPIGLEVNWGKSFAGMRGLFISAFDLGAVASYRFTRTGEDVDSSPQIGWKQLVSPGMYVLLQQKSHPITLGLGMQLTPDLRKVTAGDTEVQKNALRIGAFLSMDIPIFTFYVKHDWTRQERRNTQDTAAEE
jgi:hypothetical protein